MNKTLSRSTERKNNTEAPHDFTGSSPRFTSGVMLFKDCIAAPASHYLACRAGSVCRIPNITPVQLGAPEGSQRLRLSSGQRLEAPHDFTGLGPRFTSGVMLFKDCIAAPASHYWSFQNITPVEVWSCTNFWGSPTLALRLG